MNPFTVHTGIAAPLLRINIDTDAIIPSREMKTVGKRGLAAGLFAGWRYRAPDSREPDPDFVLNQPAHAGASILLAGANFGCGSSREHAVWALAEYGIRCVIAPSFGAIFFGNCVRNGILPVVLEEALVQQLAADIAPDPQARPITVNLQRLELRPSGGAALPFTLAPGHRSMLLEGLDPIGLTLKQQDLIDHFIRHDRQQRPWAQMAEADA